MSIYENIYNKALKRQKMLSILIDPDKSDAGLIKKICKEVEGGDVDFFMVGSSLLVKNNLEATIETLKKHSDKKVILFPGNTMQIHEKADAILFLSLISGRNAEMLIGQHVIAAPQLRKTHLEIIPTGYMLIESGKLTSVNYMSSTLPIPYDKNDIAVSTAMAGEMLGLKMIYMDAGSGAEKHVPLAMIEQVKKNISVPLIVGGGIRSAILANEIYSAGADVIVIGNALEDNFDVINHILGVKKFFK